MELRDVGRARRERGLVVLEGFHAIKHAIRFGGELLGLWTADGEELELLRARLAPDVVIPVAVELVDVEALRAVVPRAQATSYCSRIRATSATSARSCGCARRPAPRA
jgi:hypothetical protein